MQSWEDQPCLSLHRKKFLPVHIYIHCFVGAAAIEQYTIFEFSRLDWILHEMEANAGKSFQMQINLQALASISC